MKPAIMNAKIIFGLILAMTLAAMPSPARAASENTVDQKAIDAATRSVVKVINLSCRTLIVSKNDISGKYGIPQFFNKDLIITGNVDGNIVSTIKIETNGELWLYDLFVENQQRGSTVYRKYREINIDEMILSGAVRSSAGSGFAIGDGYIITNYHVVQRGEDDNNKAKQAVEKALGGTYMEILSVYNRGWFQETPYEDLAQDKVLIAYLDKNNTRLHIRVATVVYTDAQKDMALLHVPDLNLPPLRFSTRETKPLDQVVAIGFPGVGGDKGSGNFGAIREYIKQAQAERLQRPSNDWTAHVEISALGQSYQTDFQPNIHLGSVEKIAIQTPAEERLKTIFHSTPIDRGNSGGPLLNAAGNVIGINTSIASRNASYSPHRDVIAEFLGRVFKMQEHLSICSVG